MPYRTIFAITAAAILGVACVTSDALAFRRGSHGAAGGAVAALPITVASIALLSIAVPPMAHIAVTAPASPRVSVRQHRGPQGRCSRPVLQLCLRLSSVPALPIGRQAFAPGAANASTLTVDVHSRQTGYAGKRYWYLTENERQAVRRHYY
jgi:hypothetical protein